jgi:hypothetical protein
MDDRGLIDLPLRVNGLEIKITPVSPLAMSQSMEEVQNIIQFMKIAESIGQEGKMMIKVSAMLDLIAEKMAIPRVIMNSPAERQMMIQQATDAAQQVAQQNPELASKVVEGMAKNPGAIMG